jgi:hypothetical protein
MLTKDEKHDARYEAVTEEVRSLRCGEVPGRPVLSRHRVSTNVASQRSSSHKEEGNRTRDTDIWDEVAEEEWGREGCDPRVINFTFRSSRG